MEYLSYYTKKGFDKLYDETGAFFAFSTEQFNQAKEDGITYVNCGSGLLVPKGKVKEFFERFDKITKEAIQKDIEENGKENIILRELNNYECFYAHDIEPAIIALRDYKFAEDEILKIYSNEIVRIQDEGDQTNESI